MMGSKLRSQFLNIFLHFGLNIGVMAKLSSDRYEVILAETNDGSLTECSNSSFDNRLETRLEIRLEKISAKVLPLNLYP